MVRAEQPQEGTKMLTKGGGVSNEKGFQIIDAGRGIIVETSHFFEGTFHQRSKEFSLGPTFFNYAVTWLGVAAAYTSLRLLTTLSDWVIFLLCFPLFFFLQFSIILGPIILYQLTTLVSYVVNREVREWHGCEHKVAWLLQEELETTPENLQELSRIRPDCGGGYRFSTFRQRFLYTKEPNREKLEAGLDLVRRYYEEVYGQIIDLFLAGEKL